MPALREPAPPEPLWRGPPLVPQELPAQTRRRCMASQSRLAGLVVVPPAERLGELVVRRCLGH